MAGIGKYWQELVDYHNSLTHTAEEQREMWKKIMVLTINSITSITILDRLDPLLIEIY